MLSEKGKTVYYQGWDKRAKLMKLGMMLRLTILEVCL